MNRLIETVAQLRAAEEKAATDLRSQDNQSGAGDRSTQDKACRDQPGTEFDRNNGNLANESS